MVPSSYDSCFNSVFTEVNKLRKDLEEANIQVRIPKYGSKGSDVTNVQHESTLVSLKKKHADSIAEMNEQCEQLNKMKAKYGYSFY